VKNCTKKNFADMKIKTIPVEKFRDDHPDREVQSISELHPDSLKVRLKKRLMVGSHVKSQKGEKVR